MDNQISYAPKAREDLLKIKSFIEEETGDIELAKKTISDIVTTNDSLSAFPEMGPRLLINIGSKIEYRYLLCHNASTASTACSSSATLRMLSISSLFLP